MKRLTTILAAGAALTLVASAPTYAAPVGHPPTAGAGLSGTPHDFTQAGYSPSTAVGLCTFCHTPHKAQSSSLLWNHTYSAASYDWSDTLTTQSGTTLASFSSTWKGPSPKCLSCHDGSVAVGDIAWFNAQQQTVTVSAADLTGGKISNTAYQVGVGGDMAGNHPVVVPFPGVGSKNFNGTTTGVNAVTNEWVTDPTANGIVLFKASDGTAAPASVSRITAGPSGADNLGIECASCHDPHNKLSQDIFFLRGSLTGNSGGPSGYICLKCHVK